MLTGELLGQPAPVSIITSLAATLMTKEAIAKRIRELAAERSGHVSFDAFVRETGIKDKWLRSQEWFKGWNHLLTELGLETRQFGVPRTPPSYIAEAVARLIEREQRWPTEDDLR